MVGQEPHDSMSEYEATDFSKVRRIPSRASYDSALVHSIIDSTLHCQVAFIEGGRPFVIPCTHGRDGDTIFLHGSAVSRLLARAGSGDDICLNFTNIDAIVLARSLFHTSLNYRSVTLFGKGEIIEDDEGKRKGFKAIFANICPGRWSEARDVTPKELALTSVVAVHIDTAVAKVRDEGANDDVDDINGCWWAGLLPLETRILPAVPSDDLAPNIPIPKHVSDLVGKVL